MDAPASTILVTGGAGFLGWHLVRRLEREDQAVVATFHKNNVEFERAKTWRVDLTYRKPAEGMFGHTHPTAIVHTAAMTATGDCQENLELATRTNVEATQHLVRAAAELSGNRPLPYFLFLSTDLVFDGESAPYDETAKTSPIMHYGRTKETAEAVVRTYPGPWTILRPALMYGAPTPLRASFLEWILRPLREGKEVNLFSDEWRTPVLVDDVVEAIVRLLRKPVPGVLHCGGGQRLSRRDMGEFVAKRWDLPTSGLHSMRRAEAKLTCPRPKDVSLISARLSAALSMRPVGFEEGLERIQ